jgi:hypothetical protein
MISPDSLDYLPPKDWQQFERLSRALLSEVYRGRFQLWGRRGQRQNGVDAVLQRADGTVVALQCKGRSQGIGKKLKPDDIDAAVTSTAGFPQRIDEFIILTTSPDDVALQSRATRLTAERLVQGAGKVEVWGWSTVCDHISSHEKILRNFYGRWFQRLSFRQWACRVAVGCVIAAFTVVMSTQFLDGRHVVAGKRDASVQDLKQFVTLTDDLVSTYSMCDKMLTQNIFAFSMQLRGSCTEPVASRLNAIDEQIEKVAPALDAEAWTEINNLSKSMHDDYRQGLMTVDITNFFEESVIQSYKDFCLPSNARPLFADRQKVIDQAGRDAMLSQLNYYFVLRDFILPGIDAMKARVLVRARILSGEAVPEDLLRKANSLSGIVSKRNGYSFQAPDQPFTLSAIKVWADRDIKMNTDAGDDFVEKSRWQEVFASALSKVFYDRPKDVETLISCGVFRPTARELVKMK